VIVFVDEQIHLMTGITKVPQQVRHQRGHVFGG
jgi:hypothetical protein